jgi:PEP-CTERM motif
MRSAHKCTILTGFLALFLHSSASADTVYQYNGNWPVSMSITLDTTLSGAAVESLPAGTNISGDLGSLTINVPGFPPATDLAGFPLGTGAGDVVYTPVTLTIGTNAAGQITAWNIAETLFASYPAFPGENPHDFYCTWNISSNGGTDSIAFGADQDAGFCPGTTTVTSDSNLAGWTGQAVSAVPEPESYVLLSAGLIGLGVFAARRKSRR